MTSTKIQKPLSNSKLPPKGWASTNKDIYANILSLHIKQKNSDCRHQKDNHSIPAHMHIYKYAESQRQKSNAVFMKWKAK